MITSRSVALGAGLALVAGYAASLELASAWLAYETWTVVFLLPVLFIAGTLILRQLANRVAEPRIFGIAVLALGAKLLSAIVRHAVAWRVYEGSDAGYYHQFGLTSYQSYRNLDFSVTLPFGGVPGTGYVAALTGGLYALIGPSMMGAYLAFAFLAFWGQWMALLALKTALPNANTQRYALLILLLPSLLFWPSALGKEAMMQLSIGAAMYGLSQLVRRKWTGLIGLCLGLTLSWLVRPHVAGLLAVAVAIGLIWQRGRRRTAVTPIARAGAILALGVVASVLAQRGAAYVGAESLDIGSLQAAAGVVSARTEQGGSQFARADITTPQGAIVTVITVLFRPFLTEAGSVQEIASSIEGAALLYVTWRCRRSLRSAIQESRSNAFVATCIVATALLIIALAGFANFGLLARQRTQVFPFFLALLCLAAPKDTRRV